MLLALLACHGADPDWDLYPLESFFLADLPHPLIVAELVGNGADRALQVTVDAELRCPIPLADAVKVAVEGVPLVAVPGSVHGNGVGKSCWNPAFRVPLASIPPGRPAWSLALDDGVTHWEIRLARPDAPRTLAVDGGTVAPGGSLAVRVRPEEDRWIPDPAGAMPSTLQLTASSTDPTLTCTTTVEAPLSPNPPEVLAVDVPGDFCPGPALLALSSSSRRSAVLACPEGVVCRFEIGGFTAPVTVSSP